MADKKWQMFERLVTAIHIAEQRGAIVIWNETIKGRQFDVTIRFKECLTVIECKDHKKPVSAEKVDALVTKSRDIGAQNAIMVSASAYQKGAVDVARRHNIRLLSLKAINETTEEALTNQLTPVLLICDFRFRQDDEKIDLVIPEKSGILRYLMRDIMVTGPNIQAAPEDIVNEFIGEVRERATIEPQTFRVELPPDTIITHPNTGYSGSVSWFSFEYRLVFPKDLAAAQRLETLGLGVDPYLTTSVYRFKDEIEQTHVKVDISRLDIGFDTVLQRGRYYSNPHLGFSYYCEGVDNSTARMCLVESYQMGNLIQCQFTHDIQYSKQYLEITDRNEINRLAIILDKYREKA